LREMGEKRAAENEVEGAAKRGGKIGRRVDRMGCEGFACKALALFVEIGDKDIRLGEKRAQVPRNSSGTARHVKHACDVRPAAADHRKRDYLDRRAADA